MGAVLIEAAVKARVPLLVVYRPCPNRTRKTNGKNCIDKQTTNWAKRHVLSSPSDSIFGRMKRALLTIRNSYAIMAEGGFLNLAMAAL